jgi:hypothetical protein
MSEMSEMNKLICHSEYLDTAAFVLNDALALKNQIEVRQIMNLLKSNEVIFPEIFFCLS